MSILWQLRQATRSEPILICSIQHLIRRLHSSSPGTAEPETPRHRSSISNTITSLGSRVSAIYGIIKPQQSKRAKSDSSRDVGSKHSSFDVWSRADAAGVKSRNSPARPLTGSKVSPQQLTSYITACTSLKQLQQLVHKHSRHLNHIHLAAVITRLPKVQEPPPEQQDGSKIQFLGELWELLQPILQECDTRGLSNVIWAVCKLEPSSSSEPVSDNSIKQLQQEIVEQLMTPFLQKLSTANEQSISNVLYGVALGRLDLPAMQLQQLVERFLSVSHEAVPQGISNTLWAVATMQQQLTAAQLHRLLAAFASKLQQAKPQDISNTLWSVATMQQQLTAQQLQQLSAALVSKLQQANPQDISNTLWAVATMQQQLTAEQLKQLLAALISKLQQADSQAISNTLWAVAAMQEHLSAEQLQNVLAAFIGMLQQANPQHISNILWAIATMGSQVPGSHLQQLLPALEGKMEQATPRDVANAIWACAKLQYSPAPLLRAPRLLRTLHAANPQDLANIAWALGQLGHRDDQIMAAILCQAVQWEAQPTSTVASNAIDTQHVCNVCWAVSMLDIRPYASYTLQLVGSVCKEWPNIAPKGLYQLYQVHTWLLDFQLVGGQGLQELLSEQQLQQCKEAWLADINTTAAQVGSQLQQGVFAAVQRLPMHWSEPPAKKQLSRGKDGQQDGAMLIDITARTAEGALLAIEVDGPWHFRQPDGLPMGPTQYKNRALAARGYMVVSVPYHQWGKLQSNKQHQQYLMKLVQQAVQQQ